MCVCAGTCACVCKCVCVSVCVCVASVRVLRRQLIGFHLDLKKNRTCTPCRCPLPSTPTSASHATTSGFPSNCWLKKGVVFSWHSRQLRKTEIGRQQEIDTLYVSASISVFLYLPLPLLSLTLSLPLQSSLPAHFLTPSLTQFSPPSLPTSLSPTSPLTLSCPSSSFFFTLFYLTHPL